MSEGRPSLKVLLAASQAILRPPEPLPSFPPELLARLRSASSLLPESWRLVHQGWHADTELEQVGDDDLQDVARRKERREGLLLVVGWRCFSLVREMQGWLEKEFWPAEERDGLNDQDFLLGTNDLRLIRLMLSHSIASLLLPLSSAYAKSLPSGRTHDDLSIVLHELLSLLRPPRPPPHVSGPSTQRVLPYTPITQTLLSAHLSPIFLATVLLAYTPSTPPPVHADLRSSFLETLNGISPTQALGALGGAMQLVQGGKQGPGKGWKRRWPDYVEATVSGMMSAQVRRPGGVKAVIENVFGEEGNRSASLSVDEQKLEHVTNVLSRIPRNVQPEAYLPQLLSSLFDLITPAASSQDSAPRNYVHAASYTVHRLWALHPTLVRPWLEQRLHRFWRPEITAAQHAAAEQSENGKVVILPAPDVERQVRTLSQLSIYAPPAPEWLDFLVRPILAPLVALYAALGRHSALSLRDLRVSGAGKKAQSAQPSLEVDVLSLIRTWGRVVDKDNGVKGLWAVVQSTSDRSGIANEEGNGAVLFWERQGDVARLVFGRRDQHVEATSQIIEEVDDAVDAALERLDLEPDPQAFAQLLKEIERIDISSELFLMVLQAWRAESVVPQREPLQIVLYVRIVLAMMEELGQTLLAKPEHVLQFIEGVLGDEAASLQAGETRPLVIEEIGDTAETGTPQVKESDIEAMSIVETALQLLLASLEGKVASSSKSNLLLPIRAHLEILKSKSPPTIRRLAEEALTLSSGTMTVAEAPVEAAVVPAVATYRRALSFLADPILPVRAHGLSLLTSLVSSPTYDPALTPSIMDVFLRALQDEESYIYLNAAKGLAGMVDGLGKEVFRALAREYRDGAERAARGLEGEIDRVLRLGEAMDMAIHRAGKGFSACAELLVPTLSTMFPNDKLPTVLRASSMSLLSTCAEMDHLALLPWSEHLIAGTIDLVQIESVASSPFRPPRDETAAPEPKRKVVLVDDEEPEAEPREAESAPRTVDVEPTRVGDSKHPALRRAALVFLGFMFASLIEARAEETERAVAEIRVRLPNESNVTGHSVDPAVLSRADTVLRYIAQTDVDEMVRLQATQVVGLAERLIPISLSQTIRLP